jgi:hypothetical protein
LSRYGQIKIGGDTTLKTSNKNKVTWNPKPLCIN